MSIATTQEDTCTHCGTPEDRSAGPRGYCSERCYYREKGEKAINQLRSDHRLCATCFRFIKSTSDPADQWKEDKASRVQTALDHGATFEAIGGELVLDATDCPTVHPVAADKVIGYQYPTEHTDWGTGEIEREAGTLKHQRWICVCGNTDSRERDDILEQVDLEATINSLWVCLRTLYADGGLAQRPDHAELVPALRESDRDWAYAIGRTLYA